MAKKQKEQGLEGFLKSEFLDQIKHKTPAGYQLIEKYPLKPPFSYVNIL